MKQAFDKLGKQKSVSAEIGFDANADKIFTALRGEDDFTREDAGVLSDLRLSYALSSDKPLKDVEEDDDKTAGSVQVSKRDGKPLFEIRAMGADKLYARGDLKSVLELADKADKGGKGKSGKSASGREALDQLAKKADSLPSSMDAVKGALKGEWILLDPKSFEEFSKSKGGAKGSDKKLDPKAQKQLFDSLEKALGDNATFKDAGKKNGADHVKVTVPAKKFAQDLKEGLKPLKDKLGDKAGKLDGLDKVKDKDLTVDVAVKDGMVSGLTLDIAQLSEKIKGELPLTLAIKGGSGKITAPAGAKELKPQDLLGAAMFMFRDKMPGMGKGGGMDSGVNSGADQSPFGGPDMDFDL
ncbi:hypothetical protein [Streptomyces sp. ISL-11]|uniref:hypothetical protein n=1 Tax=Streptomyces sp. ISL-11 TaxID=2819174 RepID=UPI001BE9CEFF|nr:hypothetical protein [Streptomyces sp. ISL-11]MBT2384431.1 hypothetical protein [Streptomyces sp. ISL-11]